MPSARKLSAEQQIENLERRSSESLLKAQKREVVRCMELAPACIPHLLSKLSSINMRLKDVQGEGGGGGGKIPASLAQAATDRRNAAHAAATAAAQAGDGPQEQTPTKYNKVDSCSVSFMLEKILEHVEPGTMSVPNMKRMLTRGQSDANKASLVKVVEMATGMAGDFPITGRLGLLKSFQEYCQERYLSRGRRCRDIGLPPVWCRDGIYQILGSDPHGVQVLHRFTKQVATVPNGKLPPHRAMSDLFVEYNWSESRAALHSTKDPDGASACGLQFLFPNQLVGDALMAIHDRDGDGVGGGQRVQGRRNLALEDGELALAPHDAGQKRPLPASAYTTPKKRVRMNSKGSPLTHGRGELASGGGAASSSSGLRQGVASTPQHGDGEAMHSDDIVDDEEGQNHEVDEAFMLPPPPPPGAE